MVAQGRTWWMLWTAALVSLACVYDTVPFQDGDMAATLAFGRALVEPGAQQVPILIIEDGRALVAPFFFGTLPNWLFANLLGNPEVLARFVALAWVALASLAASAWQRMRGTPGFAPACALLLLLDPLMHLSARGGRVDALALAWCFLAFGLVARAGQSVGRARLARQLAAGAAFGCAVLTWPTALVCAPVLAGEWWFGACRRAWPGWQVAVSSAGAVAVGAGLVLLAWYAFVVLSRPELLEDLSAFADFEQRSRLALGALRLVLSRFGSIDPVLLLLTVAALVPARGRIELVVVAAACGLVVISSHLSDMRLVYLLPCCLLALSEAQTDLARRGADRTRTLLVCAAVAFASLRTLFAFSANTLRHGDDYRYANVRAEADRMARSDCTRLLDYANEFYFESVRRGWTTRSAVLLARNERGGLSWLHERHASQVEFIEEAMRVSGACMLVIPVGNDLQMRGGWSLSDSDMARLGYCAWPVDAAPASSSVPVGVDRFEFGGGRGFGPYRVFSASACPVPGAGA